MGARTRQTQGDTLTDALSSSGDNCDPPIKFRHSLPSFNDAQTLLRRLFLGQATSPIMALCSRIHRRSERYPLVSRTTPRGRVARGEQNSDDQKTLVGWCN